MSQSSPQQPLLSVQNLHWSAQGTSILHDISFAVSAGEFVGIIGPNGAGKSSLLRCLYRKQEADKGLITFADKDIRQYNRNQLAQKMAVVLQESPTDFDLSVLDVIKMGLIPHKSLFESDTPADHQIIQDAIKQVDLCGKENQSFNRLSGGEKQRTVIARAIVQQPQLLLMDEPTNHLDIQHQIEILQWARKLKLTVLLSIHDLNLAATFCDRLLLLNRGQQIAYGPVTEVINQTHLKLSQNVS